MLKSLRGSILNFLRMQGALPCSPLSLYLFKLFEFFPFCRHYILDLMRVTPRDSNYIGQEHRFCVLRPELVASFVEVNSSHI